MAEVIVKVGKHSSLNFSQSKVHRAVIAEELELLRKRTNSTIAIIEDFKENEEDTVREFIENFTKDKKHIFFYLPGADPDIDFRAGLADEFYDSKYTFTDFQNVNELFEKIYEITGENISTSLDLRKKIFDKVLNDETDEVIETEIKDPIIEDNNFEIENNTDISDITDIADDFNNINIDIEENLNTKEQDTETKEKVVTSVSLSKDTVVNTEEPKQNEETVNIFENEQYKNLQKINEDLTVKLEAVTKRVTLAEKLQKSISDKYMAAMEEYTKIKNCDKVIEQPISLSEYKELEKELQRLDKEVVKLENEKKELNDTILELNCINDENKKEIESLRTDLSSSKEKAEKLDEQVLNNDAYINELKESLKQLEEATEEAESLRAEMGSVRHSLNNAQSDISDLKYRLKLESSSRKESLEMTSLLAERIVSIADTNKELELQIKEKQQTINEQARYEKDSDSLLQEKTAEITKLKSKLEQADRSKTDALRLQESKYNSITKELQEKINELESINDEQKSEMDVLRGRYNKVSALAKLNSDGESVIIEELQELKETKNILSSQVSLLKKELNTERKKVEEQQSSIIALNNKVKTQNIAIQSLTKNVIEDTEGSFPSISIRTEANKQVIAVYGGGSHGVSTVATSLAHRLGKNSKVVLVDLDLNNSKLDAFVKMSPIIENAPGNPGRESKEYLQYTGMNLFITKGINYFIQNSNLLIRNISSNTKLSTWGLSHTSRIDYIGGCLVKAKPSDVMKADFSTLFTYLANNYDYVIIDLGKLGYSDLSDKLIKVVTDAASKNVLVTTGDPKDLRNVWMKTMTSRIDTRKVYVVANMINEYNEDFSGRDRVKELRRIVQGREISTFEFDESLFSSSRSLLDSANRKSRKFKGDLEALVNNQMYGNPQ